MSSDHKTFGIEIQCDAVSCQADLFASLLLCQTLPLASEQSCQVLRHQHFQDFKVQTISL